MIAVLAAVLTKDTSIAFSACQLWQAGQTSGFSVRLCWRQLWRTETSSNVCGFSVSLSFSGSCQPGLGSSSQNK